MNNNYSMTKKTFKRYAISSAITFVVAFAAAIVPVIDQIDLTTLCTSATLGIIFAAVRAGVKAVFEVIAAKSIK